jgi:hypothetical protein
MNMIDIDDMPQGCDSRDRLAQIEWSFHVRAFGEEMARVNFLPTAERKAYLRRMRDMARRKGVSLHKESLGV